MKKILVTGCGGAAAANFIASLSGADEEFFSFIYHFFYIC